MAKVDKELIKQYKLEEAVKRFNMLCEYSYFNSETGQTSLNEEGEDDEQQPQGGQMPPQGQGQEQTPPQGQGQEQMPQGGEQMPPQDGQMPPQGQGQEQMPPMPQFPQGGEQMPSEDEIEDIDIEQEGDEVIDVDDLTQAQEASEEKIDDVNNKLQSLIDFTSKFIQAIDNNDKKIDALKDELERRNPSQEEKLEIRSQAGVPYTESPQEFWVDKMRSNPNYNVSFDNGGAKDGEEEEFTITDSDIKGADDRTVSKTFDIPKKLSDYISF